MTRENQTRGKKRALLDLFFFFFFRTIRALRARSSVKEKATCELDEERELVFYYITLH